MTSIIKKMEVTKRFHHASYLVAGDSRYKHVLRDTYERKIYEMVNGSIYIGDESKYAKFATSIPITNETEVNNNLIFLSSIDFSEMKQLYIERPELFVYLLRLPTIEILRITKLLSQIEAIGIVNNEYGKADQMRVLIAKHFINMSFLRETKYRFFPIYDDSIIGARKYINYILIGVENQMIEQGFK